MNEHYLYFKVNEMRCGLRVYTCKHNHFIISGVDLNEMIRGAIQWKKSVPLMDFVRAFYYLMRLSFFYFRYLHIKLAHENTNCSTSFVITFLDFTYFLTNYFSHRKNYLSTLYTYAPSSYLVIVMRAFRYNIFTLRHVL